MKRTLDPRQELAWRTLGAGMLVTLGAAVLTLRLATVQEGGLSAVTGWPAAMLAVTWAAAWLLTARFRFLSVRRPRATLVYLFVVWILTLSGSEGLLILALVVGMPFMVQRQAGLRLLGSRRRMLMFLLGIPLAVLVFAGGFGRPGGLAGDVMVFGRFSAMVFWVTALWTLLIGMRLHFLRLRPKLLITGVLVGVVPLVLLAVFGLVLLYGSLGGSRANRARDVLQEAAATLQAGRLPELLTAEPVVWDEAEPDAGPDWAGDLVAALRQHRQGTDEDQSLPGQRSLEAAQGAIQVELGEDDLSMGMATVAARVDTTAWVYTARGYWLVHWRDPAIGQASIRAVSLDRDALTRLARAVRADVQVRSFSGGSTVEIEQLDGLQATLEGRYEDGANDPEGGWLQQPRFFGTTLVAALDVSDERLGRGYIWITLQTSFSDLAREFASTDAALNMAILIVLGIIAVVFLLTALIAFIFSLRITGGITGAVKALHRGTQRLAGGDLEVEIDLENEDEFGDLAESFNAMTVAVKQGREDAIARERLQQEMQTARQIQERLLPHQSPSMAGWEVTGVSLPSLQVGGDYFDFLQTEPGRLGVAIGDVSGKGVPAALLMSNLQASLKGQVLNKMPVEEVVGRINQLLAESTDAHMFATFIYGELDAAAGVFTSANAGHEPPLVVRRDGTVSWLTEGGLLLGMFEDQVYEPVEVQLEPGDVLVLYTDGITEAGAPNLALDEELDDQREDAMFGEERLAEIVRGARGRSALGIREAILGAVQGHLAGRAAGDDVTLVVVKRSEVKIGL